MEHNCFLFLVISFRVGRSNFLGLCPHCSQLPKQKSKTKWQLFAERKGIKKRKRMTRVFDEDIGDWVSTYGRGKKMAEKSKDWVREVKEGYVPKGMLLCTFFILYLPMFLTFVWEANC